jgi:hypothetical protein
VKKTLLRALACGAVVAGAIAACGGDGGGGGFLPGPVGGNPPATPDKYSAEVRWTQYGLPHVKAADYAGLGYGFGYAVARDHLCLLADRVVTLRGERSERFGPDGASLVAFLQTSNLNSDLFYRVQLSDEEVDAAWRDLSADARGLAEGYARARRRRRCAPATWCAPPCRSTRCGRRWPSRPMPWPRPGTSWARPPSPRPPKTARPPSAWRAMPGLSAPRPRARVHR